MSRSVCHDHQVLAVSPAVNLSASVAWSKETNVAPGVGTLAAAVAAASSGDTLLLGFGTYSGAVTVDKSLTIRAYNRGADVVIGDTGDFIIQGAGISVTLWGLFFEKNVYVNQAAEVRILENTFGRTNLAEGISIRLENYQSSEGDGSLFIIGNHLLRGNIKGISVNDAYVAGNILEDGYISSNKPGWIIGNNVTIRTYGDTTISVSSPGTAHVIANRVNYFIRAQREMGLRSAAVWH